MSNRTGPSTHLSWDELSCWNRTGKLWDGFKPGELIERYPSEWRAERMLRLAATFEDIRHILGDAPISINSAYRTSAYNAKVGGAKLSQHVMGRALDLHHSVLSPAEVYNRIRRAERDKKLPLLGGIGLYETFVHIDVRERTRSGQLAIWAGKGMETRAGIG